MTSNRCFSLTQLTATVSTYFDANERGFRLGKVENVGIEGIAYYDGQFKTGIPEGLLTFPFSLEKRSNITFSLKYFLPLILAYFK